MTPKERIAAAIAHIEPDKVPSHINATKWVVEKLKTALKVDSDKALLEALHIDVYDMHGIDLHTGSSPTYTGPENEFFPTDWAGAINSFWRIREFENKTDSGWNMDMEAPPLANATMIGELRNFIWPDNDWFDYSGLRAKLENWKDFSIMATGASVFQHATYLRHQRSKRGFARYNRRGKN